MAVRKQTCTKWYRGAAMRVTRLDNCGRPVFGDYGMGVKHSFISVGVTTNTTEGEAIEVTAANGRTCLNVPGDTEFQSEGLEIQLCDLDPEFVALITGFPLYLDAFGNPIGVEITKNASLTSHGFALELWTNTEGSDVCDDPDAEGAYGYILFPYIRGGIVGDFTIENAAYNLTITGATTRDGSRWGVGPYQVLPASPTGVGPLPTAITTGTHMLPLTTSVAPPTEYCGTRPLLDLDEPALVSIIAEPEASPSLTVEFTIDAEPAGGFWIEFGDGNWEFVESGDTATYEYLEPGTYTARATSNGVDWVSTTVTVPDAS